ncbi:MAG: cytochrome c oxidase subunit 3 [Bacteroidetes bacterium]|nr:cytochrome c oxidase subunit 3 [Bacteroidota bacterium]
MDNPIQMETTLTPGEEHRQFKQKVAIPMLWIAMISMVMLFGACTSAYIVSRGAGAWVHFELPQMFYVSTAIIIISSVTMNWTLASARKNDYKGMKMGSFITLLLGLAFVFFQFKAWGVLVDQKVFFAGRDSNAAGSFMYVLTGLHLAHLIFGIGAVAVVWIKSRLQRYNSENLLGVRLCAIFWHFLDVLWVFLFLFLLFLR